MDPSARLKILTNKANDFPFDIKIPVIRYARSLKELERMAIIYAQESQVENAFILYMKLITLSVEKLPKHPQFSALDTEQRSIIKKRCALAITIAEDLKKEIKQLYEEEYRQWIEDKQDEMKSVSQKITYVASQDNNNLHSSESLSPDFFASKSSSHTPSQNQKPSVSQSQELIPSQNQDDNKISLPSYSTISLDQPSVSVCSTTSHVYPTAPPFKDFVDDALLLDDFKNTQYKHSDTFQPNVNRSTKPLSMINDLKNNYEEAHSSLNGKRFIILPADLTDKFLLIAATNTKRNIETCGILCGRLVQSQFRVTHLIIPKQHGTSDSCTTEKEEEMFDVQDKYDLITVGWIHTHPSQTCFLSSVDLHTQCSYQQLLPEAIAVVCSPKYNNFGVYRLTMHGLKLITNCTQNGFHPHNKDPPLFEESSGINIQDSYGITIVDLR